VWQSLKETTGSALDKGVQPTTLIGKQVKVLSVEFPFYHRSYIQLCEGVTLYGESLEVKVPLGGASKYEGRSESEHLLEASLRAN
jgi:hypothetical protein